MRAARGRGLLGADMTATRRVQSPSRTRGSHSGGHEADSKKDKDARRRLVMFVQVIRGQVTDPEQVHDALDRWSRQLAAGAPGWLGSTAGLTGDGQFVALARFESEEAARRNSVRPEQDQWWMETAKLFAGEVIFRD